MLYRPATIAEAVGLLARFPEARILGGGATLVAMINAHLAEPATIVSLRDITEIRGINVHAKGVRIGAFTRHRETAAAGAQLSGSLAVLPHAARQIANTTVRNMGTIGGSISFADPGLDYPPALVAADAKVEIASAAGRRTIPARDFFLDWYATALAPGEMVAAVELPLPRPGAGIYLKHARVSGDYATASVAVSIAKLAQGVDTRLAVGGCGPKPLLSGEVNALLSGQPTDKDIAHAGELLRAMADPVDDVRGSAEYRRMLIPRMVAAAFAQAQAAMQTTGVIRG